jgi:hypothetical protein
MVLAEMAEIEKSVVRLKQQQAIEKEAAMKAEAFRIRQQQDLIERVQRALSEKHIATVLQCARDAIEAGVNLGGLEDQVRAVRGNEVARLTNQAQAAVNRGLLDQAVSIIADIDKLGGDTSALSVSLAETKERSALKQWKAHASLCVRIQTDRVALSRVQFCDASCEKMRQAIEQKWAALENNVPPPPDSSNGELAVREMCAAAGCPRCP